MSKYLQSPMILQLWIEEHKGERTGFEFELFAAIMRANEETKQTLKAKLGAASYNGYVSGSTRPTIKNMRTIVEVLGKPHLVEKFSWKVQRETKGAVPRLLRINRYQRLLTAEDMANALGVKTTDYRSLENGNTKLQVEHVPGLISVFGVEVLDSDWAVLIPEDTTSFASAELREAVINLGEDVEAVTQAIKVDLYTLVYAMCFDVIALTRDEIDRIADYLDNKKLVKSWETRSVMMKTFGELAYVARVRQKMSRPALAGVLRKRYGVSIDDIARIESNSFNVGESLKHGIVKALHNPSLEEIDVTVEAVHNPFTDTLRMCVEQSDRSMSSLDRSVRVSSGTLKSWMDGRRLPKDERAVDRLVKVFDCPELKAAWREMKNR